MMKYITNRHSTYGMRYHLIFITKYRKQVLTSEVLIRLEEILINVLNGYKIKLIEFNGESDHIHILIDSNPNMCSISLLVNILKSVTTRLLRKEFSEISKLLYGNKAKLWSRSYFVSTVGNVSLKTLKEYIKNQDRPNSSHHL